MWLLNTCTCVEKRCQILGAEITKSFEPPDMDVCSPPEQYLYLTVEPSLQPQCYLLFNIVCIPTLDLQLGVKCSIFQSYLNINYSVFVGGNMKSLFFTLLTIIFVV